MIALLSNSKIQALGLAAVMVALVLSVSDFDAAPGVDEKGVAVNEASLPGLRAPDDASLLAWSQDKF